MRKKLLLITIAIIQFSVFSLLAYFAYRSYMSWWKRQQLQKMARIDQYTVREHSNSALKYYFTLTPNTTQIDDPSWLTEPATYHFNSDGFNDSKNYEVGRQNTDTFRVITLGDSFTYGHFVDTQKNWTEVLEHTLNDHHSLCGKKNIEVINLGMPGFDVEYITERYTSLGKKYSPDLIIWFESRSGFTRVNELAQAQIISCEQNLTEEKRKQLEKEEKYYFCWAQAYDNLQKEYSEQQIQEYIKKRMERFHAVQGNTKVVFTTFSDLIPEHMQQLESWREGKADSTFIFAGVPPLSPQTTLPDGHPNQKGHQVIAEAILGYLEKSQDLFCPGAGQHK